MKEPAIVIMAKQPVEGQAKTRLCPPLTPAEAAALSEAMLRDTAEMVGGVSGAQLVVAVTPPDAVDGIRQLCLQGAVVLPIACSDIGECLDESLSQLLAAGHSKAIALNSDGPTLPIEYLDQAVDALDDADLVLGPCDDGGYYLIGLKQRHERLFSGIAWSTDRVMAQTSARIEELGLTVTLLPEWYDVDTGADLDRLRAELEELPLQSLTHTRRWLERQAAGGG